VLTARAFTVSTRRANSRARGLTRTRGILRISTNTIGCSTRRSVFSPLTVMVLILLGYHRLRGITTSTLRKSAPVLSAARRCKNLDMRRATRSWIIGKMAKLYFTDSKILISFYHSLRATGQENRSGASIDTSTHRTSPSSTSSLMTFAVPGALLIPQHE
jgi:hypothetical protein